MPGPVSRSRTAVEASPSPVARFFPIADMLLVAAALLLSACNTMRGLGEDVSTAGDTLSETSEDVKN